MALEMRRWWWEHAAVNAVHLHRLTQIQGLPNFSGTVELGVCDVEESTSMDMAGDSMVTPVDGMESHTRKVERIILSEYCNADVLEQMEVDQSLELFAQYIECISD